MDEAFQAELSALGNKVREATIPSGCKQYAVRCMEALPTLYDKFRQTNESRYGDEITRMVQTVLNEMALSERACPETQRLAIRITESLLLLHERFGLAALSLRLLDPPVSRLGNRKMVGTAPIAFRQGDDS